MFFILFLLTTAAPLFYGCQFLVHCYCQKKHCTGIVKAKSLTTLVVKAGHPIRLNAYTYSSFLFFFLLLFRQDSIVISTAEENVQYVPLLFNDIIAM